MRFEAVAWRTALGEGRAVGGDAALVLERPPLLAVADGGGDHGEAARLAMDVLRVSAAHLAVPAARLAAERTGGHRRELSKALEAAFRWVDQEVDAAGRRARHPHPGLSLLVAVLAGRHAYLAHVGRCRAWLWRRGRLVRLTEEHTVAAQRRRAGLDPAAAPGGDRLVRALGRGGPCEPDVSEVPLAGGDVVVLATDGLLERTDERGIEARVDPDDVDGSARALAALPGGDDATVVLGRLTQEVGTRAAEAIAETLRRVAVFRDLSDAERFALVPFLEERRVRAGEALVREGEHGDSFFVLVEGRVGIRRGRTELRRLGPGDHLGEISLARPGRRSATARAIEPVFAYELTRSRFLELSARRPLLGQRLALALLDTVGARLRDLTDRIAAADLVLRGDTGASPERVPELALAALRGEFTR